MCGILAVLGSHDYSPAKRARILELSRRLRHRGPDWSGLFVDEEAGCYLSHERLAIIDPTSGDQPLYNGSKNIVVAVSTASELLPLQVDTKMMMLIIMA
jgi:asparagine synthase (glutamine-hydrolysing)